MLLAYLKRQYKLLLLLAGAVCIFAAVFALYDLPLEAVLYAGALCLALGLVLFAVGYSRFLRRHRELQRLLQQVHLFLPAKKQSAHSPLFRPCAPDEYFFILLYSILIIHPAVHRGKMLSGKHR